MLQHVSVVSLKLTASITLQPFTTVEDLCNQAVEKNQRHICDSSTTLIP